MKSYEILLAYIKSRQENEFFTLTNYVFTLYKGVCLFLVNYDENIYILQFLPFFSNVPGFKNWRGNATSTQILINFTVFAVYIGGSTYGMAPFSSMAREIFLTSPYI